MTTVLSLALLAAAALFAVTSWRLRAARRARDQAIHTHAAMIVALEREKAINRGLMQELTFLRLSEQARHAFATGRRQNGVPTPLSDLRVRDVR